MIDKYRMAAEGTMRYLIYPLTGTHDTFSNPVASIIIYMMVRGKITLWSKRNYQERKIRIRGKKKLKLSIRSSIEHLGRDNVRTRRNTPYLPLYPILKKPTFFLLFLSLQVLRLSVK